MKKILKAFTLVELIVVVSIIVLISSSGAFYFFDFVKQQEISQKINSIEDTFEKLDKQIQNLEIFDYEIKLNTGAGKLGYITYINNIDIPYYQTINFDSKTGSGIITINGNGTVDWNTKIYKKQKLFLNNFIEGSSPYLFDFNEEPYYKLAGTWSGQILNEIDIIYYSQDNLYSENNNNLELIRISNSENGGNLGNIVIKNIGGKKTIKKGTTEYNKIYLIYENNGIEKFIKIEN